MGAKNDPAAFWHRSNIIHEYHTAGYKAVYHGCVVHDLMKNVQRCAIGFERALNNLDGACYSCAETLCPGQKDLH